MNATIKSTNDYSDFHLLTENRPVDMKRVVEMERYCIDKNVNFLRNLPILVNSALRRGKLTIIDGQHRFELSKRLSEPVYYIVDNDVKVEHIAPLNTYQKNWTIRDYLNFYASSGNLTYVHLKKISADNPELPFTALLDIYAPVQVSDNKGLKSFRAGTMEITNFTKGTKILKILYDFKPIFKDWNSKYFISAICRLSKHPQYNHQVMMSKLQYLSTRLVRCPDSRSYLDLLEEIYNFKNRDRISFR